ncbi:putative nucleic acid-binding protein [Halopolyspora algeriensis]|uniref:Putative nucleic acid-binding protein n=1 Tax=Halopolyspora algeriensis TaxID=1500506 RepID=A0A368VVM3_9ACTN|nr:PIN domain-containing protein [Halopolyspora algeriensis]RCW45893.1 putative nucleic acid-binding protein [Halopolyspora algeriensis]TQM55307.1 putative nucleic acid-binding protein [Halopolyspora algeriensis]
MIRVLLDTCVLFKPLLCDTLLCIAEEEVYQPLWSVDILEELERNLIRHNITEQAAQRRIGRMRQHFPDALVEDYQDLIPAMRNDPGDRHVLAAAVAGNAELVVTENLRHFPEEAANPYGLEIVSQDKFLLDQVDLVPRAVHEALTRQVSRYRREPRTLEDLVIALGTPGNGCPQFAKRCHADSC